MCENAKKCQMCNHKHRIIKLAHMEYEGIYQGVWLCDECLDKIEKENAEKVGKENGAN